MKISSRGLCFLAVFGSFALLVGAFLFQAIGYAPCRMCIWQRYPHGLAIAAGALLLFGVSTLFVSFIGAFASTTTSALGVFHTGVERDWWEGPSSCTGSGLDLSTLSSQDLLPSFTNGPINIVMCDEVSWEFLSLSMASWNFILSGFLTLIWLIAFLESFRVLRAKTTSHQI